MIRFRNVTKFYGAGGSRKYVLERASFTLPRRNIGILGLNGAGKSTLMRLIAGAELPDKGHIERFAKISWPLGFAGGVHSSLSGRENARFVARIYGESIERVDQFVEEFTMLGKYLDMPVGTYSSGMKSKLAFGISMAIDFECYLVDEITAVGDKTFQDKCRAAFAEKREKSKVIMVSHSESTIRSYCDYGAILADGKIVFFRDIEEAIATYNERQALQT